MYYSFLMMPSTLTHSLINGLTALCLLLLAVGTLSLIWKLHTSFAKCKQHLCAWRAPSLSHLTVESTTQIPLLHPGDLWRSPGWEIVRLVLRSEVFRGQRPLSPALFSVLWSVGLEILVPMSQRPCHISLVVIRGLMAAARINRCQVTYKLVKTYVKVWVCLSFTSWWPLYPY